MKKLIEIKTIALFSKPDSAAAWGALHEIVHWARRHGVTALFDDMAWTGEGWSDSFCDKVKQTADVAIAIGGDGTLLGVARALFGWNGPLLGVNLGTLGFLTDVPANDIEAAMNRLLAGDFSLEDRILLETHIQGESERALAFNDVVLSKGDSGQLLCFDVFVDEAPVYRLRADGLILCTPTGSTAYSLSAHGPILHPGLAAMALVPLCPHSLTARPITLPSSSKVEIIMQGGVPGRLHCDGQSFGPLVSAERRIIVSQASVPTKMLHLNGYSVFNTLREKLGWSAARKD